MFIESCATYLTALGAVAQCAPQVTYSWWNAYVLPAVYGGYGWVHPHVHHLYGWWR